jgi:chromosome segregation ATPase
MNSAIVSDISVENIQDYEMQLRRLYSDINVEERKNKYLVQEVQKKKNEIESINNDLKKMKKVVEKNNEQERVLKKEEVFLQKMIEFTRNHSNI